jgi:hypothetical protein
MQNKRPVVVVLGMHRSGTSLVANLLNSLGVDLGQELMPADEHNLAGYWESKTIFEIHKQILKELNCDWHNPPLSFPAEWWRKPKIEELKGNLVEFVHSECERTERIWGFKDPRTAILLPMWKEIFEELQLEPLYILTIRHPASVADSLSTRDHFASAHSEALWLKTNLDILSHAQDKLRAIVDYDRWFDCGLEQARTVINCLNLSHSVNETQIEEAVNQVIQGGLRHHSGEKNPICSPIVAKFYALLNQAATDGTIPDEISEITTTFEKSMDFLNIWDGLVTERDAIIAEYYSIIVRCNQKLERLRKQRKLLIYTIIGIIVICLIIYSLLHV